MNPEPATVLAISGSAPPQRLTGAVLPASWRGSLQLSFAESAGATRLAHCAHYGPLRVQRAFFPEGRSLAHVYLLHPPGGLVPGDTLAISIDVARGAAALVTTPAAGKCYRSDGRVAKQEHTLRVAEGASLEWLPQENIVFDGAVVHLDTRVQLEAGAVFVGWNLLCLGRPASGAPFREGRCREHLQVSRDGEPLFVERALYQGGEPLLAGDWGLAGRAATGTLVACPATAAMLDLARGVERQTSELGGDRVLVGSTLLRGGVLCCRYVGQHVAQGREHFTRIWSALRPSLLNRPAVLPRIWAT